VIDEAIVGASPWRWRMGRLNRRDDEVDNGSTSGAVDEGHRADAVDNIVGEEAPAGRRMEEGGVSQVLEASEYECGGQRG
jgi:hypothetical protein